MPAEQTITVRNPGTGEVLGEIEAFDAARVAAAVQAAGGGQREAENVLQPSASSLQPGRMSPMPRPIFYWKPT